MSAIELYDSLELVSPSPTRDEYARGPPAAVTSAPAWLTVVLLVALAYQVTSSVLEPLFLGASALLVLVAWYLSFYAKSYPKYTARNALDVDAYLGHTPGFLTSAYLAFMHRITTNAISRDTAESEGLSEKFEYGLPLKATASPHVEGLRVTSLDDDDEDSDAETLPLPSWPRSIGSNRLPKLPVIVGTIRMGFGHHRIAYSACSWALDSGSPTYFHDLLGIESKEAQMIRDADKLYSKGSRLASELGGVVEAVWGMITLAGSENSLRQTWQMAEGLIPLMMAMDKSIPVIASHSLVGMVAVACGFKTVVNCLIDNHAQWFVVVPGALNLVQGPGNLFKLRKLGVPSADIRVGGHWCPADLVNNIEDDCADRIADLQAEAAAGSGSPAGPGAARRTFLLPIGGAGAQRRFVIDLVRSVISSGLLDEGAQLVLNAGDHAHMKTAFEELLSQPGSPDYETLSTLEEVREAASDRHALKRRARVILCAFDSYFPAVATTDIMCRAADVLACKPSELAFYCIPKLMIRRVGDHEQFSAVRAYELGDGTREVREVSEALEWMRIMLEPGAEVLMEMNRRIAVNGTIGVYDGSKNAVEWAKKMAAAALD